MFLDYISSGLLNSVINITHVMTLRRQTLQQGKNHWIWPQLNCDMWRIGRWSGWWWNTHHHGSKVNNKSGRRDNDVHCTSLAVDDDTPGSQCKCAPSIHIL